jgi:hypothetical protein
VVAPCGQRGREAQNCRAVLEEMLVGYRFTMQQYWPSSLLMRSIDSLRTADIAEGRVYGIWILQLSKIGTSTCGTFLSCTSKGYSYDCDFSYFAVCIISDRLCSEV